VVSKISATVMFGAGFIALGIMLAIASDTPAWIGGMFALMTAGGLVGLLFEHR